MALAELLTLYAETVDEHERASSSCFRASIRASSFVAEIHDVCGRDKYSMHVSTGASSSSLLRGVVATPLLDRGARAREPLLGALISTDLLRAIASTI